MTTFISDGFVTRVQFIKFFEERKLWVAESLDMGQTSYVRQIFSDYAEITNNYLKGQGFDPMWLRLTLKGIFDVDIAPLLDSDKKGSVESTSVKITIVYDGVKSSLPFTCVTCGETTEEVRTFTIKNDAGTAVLNDRIVHEAFEHGHYGFGSMDLLTVARILYATQGIVVPSRITIE